MPYKINRLIGIPETAVTQDFYQPGASRACRKISLTRPFPAEHVQRPILSTQCTWWPYQTVDFGPTSNLKTIHQTQSPCKVTFFYWQQKPLRMYCIDRPMVPETNVPSAYHCLKVEYTCRKLLTQCLPLKRLYRQINQQAWHGIFVPKIQELQEIRWKNTGHSSQKYRRLKRRF